MSRRRRYLDFRREEDRIIAWLDRQRKPVAAAQGPLPKPTPPTFPLWELAIFRSIRNFNLLAMFHTWPVVRITGFTRMEQNLRPTQTK